MSPNYYPHYVTVGPPPPPPPPPAHHPAPYPYVQNTSEYPRRPALPPPTGPLGPMKSYNTNVNNANTGNNIRGQAPPPMPPPPPHAHPVDNAHPKFIQLSHNRVIFINYI